MSTSAIRNEFIIRILIATALMAGGLWYLGSLWNARMRELNLILIEPVVILMVPFYLGTIYFEYKRYIKEMAAARAVSGHKPARNAETDVPADAIRNQVLFLALAAVSVPAFYLLGGLLATLFLIVGGMLVLGVRNLRPLIITPVIAIFALWFIFIKLFGINMQLYPSFI